jgi:preprotein translocase subunit Sec61beta
VIKDANSLLEFYYSVGGLLSIKVTPSNAVYVAIFLLLLILV